MIVCILQYHRKAVSRISVVVMAWIQNWKSYHHSLI
jgi:hypothetical protein